MSLRLFIVDFKPLESFTYSFSPEYCVCKKEHITTTHRSPYTYSNNKPTGSTVGYKI